MNISFKKQHTAWFEDIPQIWDVKKVKEVYKFVSVKVSDIDYPALTVSSKLGITPQMENVAKTLNGDARKRVEVGDFVINSRADRPGACGISNFEGSVSMICHVLKPRKLDILDPTYMHYLFRNNMFSQEFFRWGRGIVSDLWSTRKDDFGNIQIPLPDLNTQKIIGNYLSKKDNSIQKLLDLKNEQLSKLEQQRQSIITEAVTKGLNPNVKMKDSGVEWIGEIPEHWEKSLLKYFLSLITDGSHYSPEIKDEGYPYITVKDLSDGEVDTTNSLKIDKKDYINLIKNGCRPLPGDVLLSKDGTIGKVAIVKDNDYVVLSSLAILRTNQELTPLYLALWLDSVINKNQMESFLAGAALRRITLQTIKKFLIILPPIDEQRKIVLYVENKTKPIKFLIENIEKQIELLKAYRQSLIYEAVTGKIDISEMELEEVR